MILTATPACDEAQERRRRLAAQLVAKRDQAERPHPERQRRVRLVVERRAAPRRPGGSRRGARAGPATSTTRPSARARPSRPARPGRRRRGTRRRNGAAPMARRCRGARSPARPRRRTALHLRADENGTSPASGRAPPATLAAIASLVLLPAVALAASAVSAATTSSSLAPPRPATASTSSRFAVSVPVLSRHSTSTWLSDSIAFDCWTSAPNRRIRIAPRA